MRVLGLFEGIGGFAIASHWCGFESAQFVEIDPNAQKVLRHHFPDVPVHDDVQTYQCTQGQFDIIVAGFPCTGTSGAGTKTGLNHPKSALFRDTLRIIYECKPRYAVVENPPGLVNRGLRAVLGGLRMAGYSSELIVISAARLGAGHRRQRLFVVSYPHIGGGNPTVTVTGPSEVRTLVQEARTYARWLQVKPTGYGNDYGVCGQLAETSVRLDPWHWQCKANTPGRLTARILAGRAVTPQQALIPLLRIKDLEDVKETLR